MSFKKITNSIQSNLGLAKYELTVLTVIFSGLILGIAIKSYNNQNSTDYKSIQTEIYNALDSIAEVEKTTYIGTDYDGNPIPELKSADTIVQKENFFGTPIKKEDKIDGKLINLNTASRVELMNLPGIGEKTAEKIIEYRNQFGFKNIEDIMNVKGIGEKKFEKMKEFIVVK